MSEPYSYEINLKKKRIVLHYEGKNDVVIDEINCKKYVEKDVIMPDKKELDRIAEKEIKKRIDAINAAEYNKLTKDFMLRELSTDEKKKSIRQMVELNEREKQKIELSREMVNKNMNDAVNADWLDNIKKEI